MFKCLDRCRQEEIILLDCEDDQSRLPELRKAGRTGELLCPECKQPVLVKAGRNKAWHFAHKDLGSCPLAVETAAILQARRLLYRWLLEKHVKRNGLSPTEMANVTVEKRVLPRGDRPADCFVEFPDGHGFGYWILERGMRNRSELESSVKKGILHPVFLYSMLKPAESDATAFDLTPTERGLMVSTKYDPAYGSGEGSLHYLDCKSNMMTTLRAMVLRHAPQRYHAETVLAHPMEKILTDRTGLLIHPGEHKILRVHEERMAERARKRKQKEEERRARREKARHLHGRTAARETSPWGRMQWALSEQTPTQQNKVNTADPPSESLPETDISEASPKEEYSEITRKAMGLDPLRCERCGRETTDWISAAPGEGTCLCRICHEKRSYDFSSRYHTTSTIAHRKKPRKQP